MNTQTYNPAELFKNFQGFSTQGKETFEKAFQSSTNNLQKAFEQTSVLLQKQFEETQAKITKTYEEATIQNRDNMEAMLAAGSAFAAGVKNLSEQTVSITRKSVDTGVSNAKALASVKDLDELISLQTGFTKTALETMVCDAQIIQEMTSQVTQDALTPLQERAKAVTPTTRKPKS